MVNVISSAYSARSYSMLLTTIFQYFNIDLDGESDIRICKPSEAIDNGSISHLGYELHGNEWFMNTTCVPAIAEEASDEEAAMDIPPPTAAPLSPPPTVGAGSSSATFDYASAFHNLS